MEWLGQHLVRHAVATVKRVTRVQVPDEPEMRFVIEPETVGDGRVLCEPEAPVTEAHVLWCQLLTDLYTVWMEAKVFAHDRVQ